MTGEDTIRVGQLRKWAARWDEHEDDPLVFLVVSTETVGRLKYATVLLSDGSRQVHRLGHLIAFSDEC